MLMSVMIMAGVSPLLPCIVLSDTLVLSGRLSMYYHNVSRHVERSRSKFRLSSQSSSSTPFERLAIVV